MALVLFAQMGIPGGGTGVTRQVEQAPGVEVKADAGGRAEVADEEGESADPVRSRQNDMFDHFRQGMPRAIEASSPVETAKNTFVLESFWFPWENARTGKILWHPDGSGSQALS